MTNISTFGTPCKKGIYRRGVLTVAAYLRDHADAVRRLGVSDSELRVLQSVSRNEGNLDALNTWDNSFLSFGIFQWTAGTENNPGELADLLDRLKRTVPECFHKHFGKQGLDTTMARPNTGWLVLHGRTLNTPAQKESLRDVFWVERFILAAQDPRVAACEIAHAVARLNQFYYTRHASLGTYALCDLFTSEYAVALMLDHHVNRPGHFPKHAARALEAASISPQRLADGDAALAKRAIDAYLRQRESSSMTDAAKRAQRVKEDVTRGALSDSPHSFIRGAR